MSQPVIGLAIAFSFNSKTIKNTMKETEKRPQGTTALGVRAGLRP